MMVDKTGSLVPQNIAVMRLNLRSIDTQCDRYYALDGRYTTTLTSEVVSMVAGSDFVGSEFDFSDIDDALLIVTKKGGGE